MAIPMPKPVIAIQAATKPVPDARLVVVPTTRPAPITANPSATVTLAPNRRATRLAGTAPNSSPPIRGSSRSPDPMALAPSTPWKY